MKVGYLTKADGEKSGISNFSRNLRNNLDVENIYYSKERFGPLATTRSNLFTGDLKEKLEQYDKVILEDQTLMVFDPTEVDCKIIPYVHDIIPVTSCYKKYNRTVRGRLRGYLSTLSMVYHTKYLVKCEHIITASEQVKREVESRTAFTGRADVVYQGVDNLPETSEHERDIDLLYVGGLLERKDPWLLRECLEKAEQAGFNVAHVTSDPGLPGTHFEDVSDEKLAELYGRTRFYLHPSYAEGFGRCPVEAQRYGVIPLAKDLPINREVLGEQFLIVDSAQDVVDNLHRSYPGKRRDRCRKKSERFKWNQTASRIAEILGIEKSDKETCEVTA